MKKIMRRVAIVLFFVAIIPSCNLEDDCKICTRVKNDGGIITREIGIPTCGDALAEREAEEPVTINGVTTYWECK